jgi:hypothetical protein
MACYGGSGNLNDGQLYFHEEFFESVRAHGPDGLSSRSLDPAMLPCGAVGAQPPASTTPALTGADSRRWTPSRRKG